MFQFHQTISTISDDFQVPSCLGSSWSLVKIMVSPYYLYSNDLVYLLCGYPIFRFKLTTRQLPPTARSFEDTELAAEKQRVVERRRNHAICQGSWKLRRKTGNYLHSLARIYGREWKRCAPIFWTEPSAQKRRDDPRKSLGSTHDLVPQFLVWSKDFDADAVSWNTCFLMILSLRGWYFFWNVEAFDLLTRVQVQRQN